METNQEDLIVEDIADQQDWLRKIIPYDWCDNTELIPRLMFAMLIHFVEKENGLSQLNMNWDYELEHGHITQSYIDKINGIYGELRDAYNYVKTERPQLEIDLDNSYPEKLAGVHEFFEEPIIDEFGNKSSLMNTCETLYGLPFEEVYRENMRIEKLIDDRDQWAMNIIVKYVNYLWT